MEHTAFGRVDNSSVIAQEEIFGPVLSVVPAQHEANAIRVAKDTIYGPNAFRADFGGPAAARRSRR